MFHAYKLLDHIVIGIPEERRHGIPQFGHAFVWLSRQSGELSYTVHSSWWRFPYT